MGYATLLQLHLLFVNWPIVENQSKLEAKKKNNFIIRNFQIVQLWAGFFRSCLLLATAPLNRHHTSLFLGDLY